MLLTTHDLGDIERLCNRLLVIDHGKLIWDGRIADLKERYGAERTLIVDLEEPAPPLELDGARVEKVDGPRQWLRFRGSAAELTARRRGHDAASSTCRSPSPTSRRSSAGSTRAVRESDSAQPNRIRAIHIRSGASTPTRSRLRAITCCVARQRPSRNDCAGSPSTRHSW